MEFICVFNVVNLSGMPKRIIAESSHMNTHNESWKKLTLPYDVNTDDAVRQQHHAAQFIALVGRHLIPRKPDDSNTNMDYIPEMNALVGNTIAGGLRIGFQMADMVLFIADENFRRLHSITLAGKTKHEVFIRLKEELKQQGVNVDSLISEPHYEIPEHPLDKGAVFSINDRIFFEEMAAHRHNAQFILAALVHRYIGAAPIKVWPHHFDTGTIIPLAFDEEGEIMQSLGLGWAIPDSMVAEPYFYLSFWSAEPVEHLNRLPLLTHSEWITSGWQGGIMKLSEILKYATAEEQHGVARFFFETGINILLNHSDV